jgi:hypothetical protein
MTTTLVQRLLVASILVAGLWVGASTARAG